MVDVFQADGRRVAQLFDAVSSGGTHSLAWNARGVPSGIYFLRATAGTSATTKKLTILE
jgi:hypothetical protein